MPENTFSCPECGAKMRTAAPPAAGKRVKCVKCDAVFTPVGEDDPPRKPRAAGPSRGEAVSATRGQPRLTRRRSQEEDDDRDDPKPRRGTRRPEPKGGNTTLFLVLGLAATGVFVVLAGGAALAFVLTRATSRTETSVTVAARPVVVDPAAPPEVPPAPRPVAGFGPPRGDGIPARGLQELKAATVFVRVEAAGLSGSGSGFVVRVDGDTAYVVTNNHVINPKVEVVVNAPVGPRNPRFPPRFQPPMTVTRTVTLPDAVVTAVFSGGTKAERAAAAEVVAFDPEHDLAVLKVKGVPDLRAIDISQVPELSETMPVFVLGFPFGAVLATGKGSPAITVGKGTVSSVRLDDRDEVAYVQIDGALNPGNSGGPVVDTDGRLVGVAVATIKGSSGIGLAIPVQRLTQVMAGRVGPATARTLKADGGGAEVGVEVPLIDPLGRLRSVALLYLPGDVTAAQPAGKAGAAPAELAGATRLDLTPEPRRALGTLRLPAPAAAGAVYSYQVSYTGADGRPALTDPATFRVSGPAPPPVAVRPPTPPPPVSPTAPATVGPRIVGGLFGGDTYRDAAPEGGLLVGLEVGVGPFAGLDMVHSVRAVYRVGDVESLGPQRGTDLARVTRLVARPGYAVGSMTVRAGANADGLRLTFMRVKGDNLDPADSYESDWVGDTRPVGTTLLTGDGQAVVGVVVKANAKDVTGLGIVRRVEETGVVGGFFDPTFRDEGPEGGLLVGFDVTLSKFGPNDIIRSARPVYRTPKGEAAGRPRGSPDATRPVSVKAKEGYAVGAMTAKALMSVDGFSVTFMKVTAGRLDPADAYESEWVGGKGGGPETRVGGDGRAAVGLAGKQNAAGDLTGLGLLVRYVPGTTGGAAPAPPPPPALAAKDPPMAKDPPAAGGREFAPKNNRFTAQMPAGGRWAERTRTLTVRGQRVALETAVSSPPDGNVYTAASVGIPATMMRQIPAEGRLDGFRASLTEHLRATVSSEKALSQGAAAGKESLLELPGGRAARMQMYIVGGWVIYALVEGPSKDAVNAEAANAFFASFKLKTP